jgi:hypothetical protein
MTSLASASPTSVLRSLKIPRRPLTAQYRHYLARPQPQLIDRLMANYFDIEVILDLYSQDETSYLPFESPETLLVMQLRWQLPPARDFWELLRSYDIKYPTSRSYYRFRNGGVLREQVMNIPWCAIKAGQFQVFWDYLRMDPAARCLEMYWNYKRYAAAAGDQALFDLIESLITRHGPSIEAIRIQTRKKTKCWFSAIQGGNLTIIQRLLPLQQYNTSNSLEHAVMYGHLPVLNLLFEQVPVDFQSLYFQDLVRGAGYNGDPQVIAHIAAITAFEPYVFLCGAASRGHVELIRQWLPDVSSVVRLTQILCNCIRQNSITTVKLVYDRCRQLGVQPYLERIQSTLEDENYGISVEIVEFLMAQELGVDYNSLLINAVGDGRSDLVSLYLKKTSEVVLEALDEVTEHLAIGANQVTKDAVKFRYSDQQRNESRSRVLAPFLECTDLLVKALIATRSESEASQAIFSLLSKYQTNVPEVAEILGQHCPGSVAA